MEQSQSVAAPKTVDTKKPLSAYVVSRTFVLPTESEKDIVAVKGYGATADKLVAKVANITLLPGETSYISSPIYATGLSALALDNEDFDNQKVVGVLITTFKPR